MPKLKLTETNWDNERNNKLQQVYDGDNDK